MLRYAIVLALIPVPALADEPTHSASVVMTNVCTGTINGIEASRDSTPGAWAWLLNQHCAHGTPANQPTEFSFTPEGAKKVWKAGWQVATTAYAHGGTVTVEYAWFEGMKNSAVPVVTRINAPCMSGTNGGC